MTQGRRFRVFELAVVAVAVLCYANALDGAFVAGDLQFIQKNPVLQQARVVLTAFTRGYWWVGGEQQAGGTYYRPLLVLLDAWDHLLWGARPFGYHLTNVVLHGAATLVTARLARAWIGSPRAAVFAALLFATHPIHVHAVSYISARSEVLCTSFYAGAVLTALRCGRETRARDLVIMAALYVGGLLSHEAAVTMPVACSLALASRDRRSGLARAVLAFVLITAAYLVLRRVVLGDFLTHKEALTAHLPPLPAALTIAKILLYYLVKLVAPTELSYLPPFIPVLRAGDAVGLVSLSALIGLSALVVAGPRRLARERAALGWVLLSLLPTSGVMPLDHFVKGQYAYLPSVGFCILVASLARRGLALASQRAPARAMRLAFGGASAIVVVASAGQTLLENLSWKTPAALYERVIELEPAVPEELFSHPVMTPTANRFAAVHLLYAVSLVQEADCTHAKAHAARAERLTRRRTVKRDARRLQADCMFAMGDTDGALAAYLAVVGDTPADGMVPARIAALLLRQGKPEQAMPYLGHACALGIKRACAPNPER